MSTDAQGRVELKAGIDCLLESKDEQLMSLGNVVKKNDEFPSEEEMAHLLGFFLTFSMGCADIGLSELSEKFSGRAKKFMLVLNKWGLHPGRVRNYVRENWDPLAYNRIVKRATAMTAYQTVGSVDKY